MSLPAGPAAPVAVHPAAAAAASAASSTTPSDAVTAVSKSAKKVTIQQEQKATPVRYIELAYSDLATLVSYTNKSQTSLQVVTYTNHDQLLADVRLLVADSIHQALAGVTTVEFRTVNAMDTSMAGYLVPEDDTDGVPYIYTSSNAGIVEMKSIAMPRGKTYTLHLSPYPTSMVARIGAPSSEQATGSCVSLYSINDIKHLLSIVIFVFPGKGCEQQQRQQQAPAIAEEPPRQLRAQANWDTPKENTRSLVPEVPYKVVLTNYPTNVSQAIRRGRPTMASVKMGM